MAIKYIKLLDGLRAIAALPIIFYHLNPEWIESGYLGVDVFFVISGFLISSIILKKLGNNNFSFSNFYSRRIKRLMPAYFVTIIVSYSISFFLLLSKKIAIVEKENFFCLSDNSCNLFDETGNPLIWGESHLTIIGFERFGGYFKTQITE